MNEKKILQMNGVPIIGQRMLTMVCAQGHVDEMPAPMTYQMPPAPGTQTPMNIVICRICMMVFLAGMSARQATEQEMEFIRRKRAEEDTKNAEESA